MQDDVVVVKPTSEILHYVRRWGVRRTIAVTLAYLSRKLNHNFDFQELDKVVSPAKYEKDVDELAARLAEGITEFLREDNYAKYFTFWESRGFHITRNHYYEPIPDTRTLTPEIWERESQLLGVEMNIGYQLHLLRDIFPKFKNEYNTLPTKKPEKEYCFYFDNPNFSRTDALVLYCMIRHLHPKTVLEVGGGFSTRLSAHAALRNGDTSVVSIEPYPDEVLKSGFPGLTKLITKKAEDISLDLFLELSSGDILFIDSSHSLKIGGDVAFLYLEVLPRLKEGVVVHIHDIFFPREMPKEWVLSLHKFWTEQYLVQAFLTFNSAFEVMFCNSYMGLKYSSDMKDTFPNSPWHGGGSLWIRKRKLSA
jgi:predicted O-methyltransferase YrrM